MASLFWISGDGDTSRLGANIGMQAYISNQEIETQDVMSKEDLLCGVILLILVSLFVNLMKSSIIWDEELQ